MNKRIISFIILIFPVFLTGCNNQISAIEQDGVSKTALVADKIEIIDFHSVRRCMICLGMEKNAKATLDKYFSEELANGKITFQSVNVEESALETQELVGKYQATGTSLFINVIKDGQDHIEQDITAWRFARRDKEFQAYFKEEIENLLQ